MLSDNKYTSKSNLEDESDFSDAGLKSICLEPFRWNGHRYHAETTPPVQLIPDIFSALERSSTFPGEVDFSISAPNDLTILEMSSGQLHRISHVLHRVKRLNISIYPWCRGNSFASNDRPYSEIQHLGNLACAFCDIEELEGLTISFRQYPCDNEVPTISAAQVLPLQTRTWPRLQTLALENNPFHQEELSVLKERCSEELETLELRCPFFLFG